MTSDQIFASISHIAATAGKNDKQKLVAAYGADEDFKKVLVLALNPFITFGMKNLPVPAGAGTGVFEDVTWLILSKMADRTCTGHDARDTVQMEMDRLSPGSAELLGRIITKDLKAGFGESTVNKAIKGTIPDFPYMRCSLPKDTDFSTWPWAAGVIVEEKADGMFANVDYLHTDEVSIRSRQGTEFPMDKFSHTQAAVRRRLIMGTQTHGEFVVKLDGVIQPREESNGIMRRIVAGGDWLPGEVPHFLAWDQVPLTEVKTKARYKVPYKTRLKDLIKSLNTASGHADDIVGLVATRVVHSLKDAYGFYREMLVLGKEGAVVKNPDMIWKDGTSNEQIKLKLTAPCEVRIVGFNEGTGKNVGRLGSFRTRSECGQVEVDVNGKSDKMRDDAWKNRESLLDTIIQIDFNDIMEPSKEGGKHSLFLPVFGEYRPEKKAADTLERIIAQFEAAKEAA